MNGNDSQPSSSPVGTIVAIAMFGIINLLKPKGVTSRDCVNHFQRFLWPLKVGHAGTLDPNAEGVLLIAVGSTVRLIQYIQELPKSYRGTFWLGRRSDSADIDTLVEPIEGCSSPTRREIEFALDRFRGTIRQVPPIYSAIRVEGKRAYVHAREGREVQMPEREVHIHRLELISMSEDRFTLEVDCSGGTYIRSLGRDIARACGSDAVMTELVRTGVGSCRVEEATRLEEATNRDEARAKLLNPAYILPRDHVVLHPEEVRLVRHGVFALIEPHRIQENHWNSERLRDCIIALDSCGQIRSVMTPRDGMHWGGKINFDVTPPSSD